MQTSQTPNLWAASHSCRLTIVSSFGRYPSREPSAFTESCLCGLTTGSKRAAAFSQDGARAYVTSDNGASIVIDAATHKLIAMIPVGQRPWGIALTPDGRKLYAGNGLSNDVSVIDTATNQVVKTIKAGDGPWGIAIPRPR